MSSSTRKKGERFAKLNLELLRHPAVTTLPHAAFRVLTVFAAGYKGDNNGLLCCTDTWMKQFGMTSRDTTYRAIQALIERGLIEVMRPGIKQRKVATLYAITWQELNYRNGELLGRFTPASHAYKLWQLPARQKKKVPDCRKIKPSAEIQSDSRTSTSPIVGHQTPVSSPTMSTKNGVFQSDGREYLRLLAPFPDSTGSLPAPVPASGPDSPVIDPIQKTARSPVSKIARIANAKKLLSIQPDVDNAKLATMYELNHDEIQQARAL